MVDIDPVFLAVVVVLVMTIYNASITVEVASELDDKRKSKIQILNIFIALLSAGCLGVIAWRVWSSSKKSTSRFIRHR